MSGFNLDAIAENASRLGMRLQETFSEHTRDFAISRGSGAGYMDNPDDKLKDVRRKLDVGPDRERLEALKQLIAVRHPQDPPHCTILTTRAFPL
jgi:AP-3 complex subunit beta